MTCTHSKADYVVCPVCHFEPFVRNHYFDGKFMVARDFIDETKYHSEKLRHHHVRLHGWGVACGLLIGEHPTDQCQDHYITLKPGAAIDCCGHEILVADEEMVEVKSLLKELYEKERGNPKLHTLQVCITFRECGTEEVPVLYDECGCDDTKCDHNRILESYNIELLTDQPLNPDPHHNSADDWGYFLKSGGIWRMSHRAVGQTRYVISETNPNQLIELDPEQRKLVATRALPTGVRALAVAESNDGSRIYIAAEASSGNSAHDRRLLVFDEANLATIKTENVLLSSGSNDVALAVIPAPDNRLLALVGRKDLLVWDTTLDSASPQQPDPNKVVFGSSLKNLAVSADGKHVYSLDTINRKIIGADISGTTAVPIVGAPVTLPLLSHEPVAVAVDSAGSWAFVLEQDGTDTFIEIISLDQVRANQQPSVVSARRIANTNLSVMAMGSQGSPALVKIEEGSCENLIWTSHTTCPSCDLPNCVVLATIERYQLDAKLRNVESTAVAAADIQNKIARIDNRKGRRILARTEALQELFECLLRRGGGGADGPRGPQGLTGPAGPAGPALDSVNLEMVPCGQPALGQITTDVAGKKTLDLKIPTSCGTTFTHVAGINWTHNEDAPEPIHRGVLGDTGLLIAFDQPVRSGDIHPLTLKVLSQHRQQLQNGLAFTCWCEVEPKEVHGVNLRLTQLGGGTFQILGIQNRPLIPDEFVNGARFLAANVDRLPDGMYRVILEGDLIRDRGGRGVDANHLPKWLPKRPTGDGVEGGIFQSWFALQEGDAPQPGGRLINVNAEPRDVLTNVRGIGPSTANRILRARATRPFRDVEDFRARVRPNERDWDLMKNEIVVKPSEE